MQVFKEICRCFTLLLFNLSEYVSTIKSVPDVTNLGIKEFCLKLQNLQRNIDAYSKEVLYLIWKLRTYYERLSTHLS